MAGLQYGLVHLQAMFNQYKVIQVVNVLLSQKSMADDSIMSLSLIRSWVWNTTERVETFVVACWTAPTGHVLVYKKDLEPMFLEEPSEAKTTDRLMVPNMGSGPVSHHKYSVFSKLGT
jgi:hypothetical protein